MSQSPDSALTTERPLTLLDVLNRSVQHLQKKKIEKARLQSELLIAHALNLPRLQLYLQFDRPLSTPELDSIRTLIRRRSNFEPLQYILGTAEFMSLPFSVTPQTLIPRPETEILVESAIQQIRLFSKSGVKVCDIGTGCGNIAIAIKSNCPDISITAVDISPTAIAVAQKNAAQLGFATQIDFKIGNLFESVPGEKFDLIVSNPPYVVHHQIKELEPEIIQFEPHSALDGGKDGLEFYRRIIAESQNHLNDSGFLLFEIGQGQITGIRDIFQKFPSFHIIKVIPDLTQIERVIVAQLNPNS